MVAIFFIAIVPLSGEASPRRSANKADLPAPMEVITEGTPVEVNKHLALGDVTLWRPSKFRPKIEKQPREHSGLFCCQPACRERAALRELC
jgi:hypothetical protein